MTPTFRLIQTTLALAVVLIASSVVAQQPAAAKPKPATPAAKPGAAATPDAPKPKDAPAFATLEERVSYALGMNLGTQLHRQSVDIDPNLLLQGLKDAMSGGKTKMTDEEAKAAFTELQGVLIKRQQEKKAAASEANKKEGEPFLAANKSKEGVVTLPSGLQYKILTPGTGPKPTATDTVVCNYRGTFINGTEFDSSAKHGGPATFTVGGVIKGWTEALQLMPTGSKWQLFVPSNLAYGENGTPDGTIGPNATLIFEVELLSIQLKEPAPSGDKK